MKVLITGGTGKIGQKLVSRLINKNLSIRVLCRKSNSAFSNKIVIGDLLNQDSLIKAVQGVDVIIHLAAVNNASSKEDYWQTNVKGTENLIKTAKNAGVRRFIFTSTWAINPSGGAYSQSKLAAEEIVRNSELDWIILRPSEVYGTNGMVGILIRLIRKNYLIPVIKHVNCQLAPIYIDDVIDVLEKLVSSNLKSKIYTLTGPENLSFEDLVDQICHFYKLKRIKINLSVSLIRLALKPILLFKKVVYNQDVIGILEKLDRLLLVKSTDINLARKDLGFNPINFKQGLNLLNNQSLFLKNEGLV